MLLYALNNNFIFSLENGVRELTICKICSKANLEFSVERARY